MRKDDIQAGGDPHRAPSALRRIVAVLVGFVVAAGIAYVTFILGILLAIAVGIDIPGAWGAVLDGVVAATAGAFGWVLVVRRITGRKRVRRGSPEWLEAKGYQRIEPTDGISGH